MDFPKILRWTIVSSWCIKTICVLGSENLSLFSMSPKEKETFDIREVIEKDEGALFTFKKVQSLLSLRLYGEQELEHTIDVCNLALDLLNKEKVQDPDVAKIVAIASLVHDVGRYLEDKSSQHHTEITVDKLAGFVHIGDFEFAQQIAKCVQRHSSSSKEKPDSLEEKIVFDADNLSIFTEFGVKRWFFKAETWGHAMGVQEADMALKEMFTQGTEGNFFYLKSSLTILKQSFYARHMVGTN